MEKRRELGDLGHLSARAKRACSGSRVCHAYGLLTAGASASALMVFIMEQWRACVFIVLNLILLSILLTSVSANSEEQGKGNEADRVPDKAETKEMRQCRWPPATVDQEAVKECEEEEWFDVEDRLEAEEEISKLSKEALNEKAEAFIAMFRQHLISDARKQV